MLRYLLQMHVSHGLACLGLNDCLCWVMPSFVELTSLVPAPTAVGMTLDPVRYWDAFYVFYQHLTGMRTMPIYESCWYHRTCDTSEPCQQTLAWIEVGFRV
jgi:hypothetical protein